MWRALPSAPSGGHVPPRGLAAALAAADDKVGVRWPRTSLRTGVGGVADSMLAGPRVSLTISQGWEMIRYLLSPEQAEEWHVGDPQEKSPVLGHKPHLHLISEPVFPKQPGEWKPSTAKGNLVPRGTGTAPFRARTSEKRAASLGVPVP